MDSNNSQYEMLLGQLAEHLRKYGVTQWPERIDAWLAEYKRMDEIGKSNHRSRTKRALGGMGSIGDIVIYKQKSHRNGDGLEEINDANERLLTLIEDLYAIVKDTV